MASAHFQCPHCQQPIKAIPLANEQHTYQATADLSSPTSTGGYTRSRRGFWSSLTGTYATTAVLAGVLVWLYCWWYEINPIWAVLIGLLALFGLPALELILHAPPKKKTKSKPMTTNIKVVMTEPDRETTYLDHFRDDTIQLEKLMELAQLVVANELTWLGRPTVCKRTGLTQTDYHKIVEEFSYQGYLLDDAGNNHRLSRRGRAFMRQLAALPSLTAQTIK